MNRDHAFEMHVDEGDDKATLEVHAVKTELDIYGLFALLSACHRAIEVMRRKKS